MGGGIEETVIPLIQNPNVVDEVRSVTVVSQFLISTSNAKTGQMLCFTISPALISV